MISSLVDLMVDAVVDKAVKVIDSFTAVSLGPSGLCMDKVSSS